MSVGQLVTKMYNAEGSNTAHGHHLQLSDSLAQRIGYSSKGEPDSPRPQGPAMEQDVLKRLKQQHELQFGYEQKPQKDPELTYSSTPRMTMG